MGRVRMGPPVHLTKQSKRERVARPCPRHVRVPLQRRAVRELVRARRPGLERAGAAREGREGAVVRGAGGERHGHGHDAGGVRGRRALGPSSYCPPHYTSANAL